MTASQTSRGAQRLFAISVVARLPLAMLSIGVLVHVERLTGSFAAAGTVAGTLAVAQGAGGPLLGRLIDRRGQTALLVAPALVAAAALAGIAVLPAGAPLWALVVLASALGIATPPVAACMRTLFPALLPDGGALRRAYAVDAAAVEATWACGPPIVLLLGAAWSTGAALAAAAIVLLTATVLFAASPASRRWRPPSDRARAAGGVLRTPAMRTLVLVLVALGAAMVVAGTMIAPTLATAYSMVNDAAPAGTATEAFAWLTTAMALGTSAGAAGAGAVADSAGPEATFVVAAAAAGAAAVIAALRSRTLPGHEQDGAGRRAWRPRRRAVLVAGE
jgi:predicted MFS family arabinose efflux permease